MSESIAGASNVTLTRVVVAVGVSVVATTAALVTGIISYNKLHSKNSSRRKMGTNNEAVSILAFKGTLIIKI